MNKNPDIEEKKKVKQFGQVGFVFFLLLGLLTRWRHHEFASNIFIGVSVFFLVMTLVSPPVMRIVFRGWMAVVGVIGWVNRQLLLSVVYFFMFAPVNLILKLLGRDFMNRRLDPAATTYWEPHAGPPADPARYEQRF